MHALKTQYSVTPEGLIVHQSATAPGPIHDSMLLRRSRLPANLPPGQGVAAEEIQANQFASELLMPKPLLLKHLQAMDALEFAPNDDNAFDRIIVELATRFEVSKQAMTIRLSSLFA